MKINQYTSTTSKEVSAPTEFSGDINMPLISQAVHVYRNRLHLGTAIAQTRGDVTARKGKVYRQKGTGNARHGAKSAPIFVGGGKAHGPKGVKRVLEMPKKMRVKALRAAMSYKLKNGAVSMFSAAKLEKTQDAAKLMSSVRKGENAEKSKYTVVLSDKNAEFRKALSNLENTVIVRFSDLNAYNVFTATKLVFDADAFAIEKKAKKEAK